MFKYMNIIVLMLICIFSILVCGCLNYDDIPVDIINAPPELNLETKEVTVNYKYSLDGEDYMFYYKVYYGVVDYLGTEDHTYVYDENKEVYLELFENETNNKYMSEFADKLESHVNDEDLVDAVVSMVQNLKYDYDMAYELENIDPYGDFYYPYETLSYASGVCSDKSILLACILKELGYDVVLFNFIESNHMGVGIKTGDKYDYQNTGYAYIESTVPAMITFDSGYIVGNEKPIIIHVTNGGKVLHDLEEEYNDMKRLKEIDNMPTEVSEDIYYEWVKLVAKYSMEDHYI